MTSGPWRPQLYPALVGIVVGMVVAGLGVPLITRHTDSGRGGAASVAAGGGFGAGSDATASAETGAAGGGTATPAMGAGAGPGGGGVRGSGAAAGNQTASAIATSRGAAAKLATEVGVTDTTVKLGFIILDLGGASQTGFDFGLDPKQQQAAIQAAVDGMNARGGVAGRKIVAAFATFNVLDSFTGGDSGHATCVALTEDQHVFAVVGYLLPSDQLCVTREHKTPLLSDAANNLDTMFAASEGRLISVYPRANRIMADFVAKLDAARYLGAKPVGIVVDEALDPQLETGHALEAYLQRAGHKVVRVSRISGQLSQASSQMPVEVSQQRAGGAEAILFLSNPLYIQQFIQTAEGQQWYPSYGFSDFGNGTADPSSNMPKSMNGAFGLASAYPGVGTKDLGGTPEAAPAVRCRENYEKRSGQALPARGTNNKYAITMSACDDVHIFATLAGIAGRSLTRTSFAAAVTRVGRLGDLARTPDGSYGPGKLDLVDATRYTVYDADCNCWHPRGGFQPMAD